MSRTMKAIEVTGTVDADGQLHLDEPLSALSAGPVRVILLVVEEADIDEREWLRSAANNPAFEFLKDPGEDIYTPSDGRPFDDEG